MDKNKIYIIIRILALLGILLAVYLMWQQLAHPEFKPCSINATVNCDAIITGAVSKTLGIPTPLYGLVGYIVIFFSALFKWKKLMLAMTTFGLLFCLWIGYQELFLLHVICPVCIGCQLIMIGVFTLSVVIIKKEDI